MQNVESGTRGHNLGRQVKNIYAKPAFFYKNSLVYTSIEVMLLVSFPLLSVLIVAERVNFCESYTYVISIIIQLIEGFIISFIFYNLNIANEKEDANINALYTIAKLHIHLNSCKSIIDNEVGDNYKKIQCKEVLMVDENPMMVFEVSKFNAYLYKINADIEYFMHPMGNIATNSNFMINLFICDMNIKLNKLKSLRLGDKNSKMMIYKHYEKLNELIADIIVYIDDFTLKFSDSEMVKQKLKSYTEYIKEYFKDLEQHDQSR